MVENFALPLLLILDIFNLNCFSYMKYFYIYEGVMHARICLEHTVSTNSVMVTYAFKAKLIAAANIIKTACT